MSLLFYKSKKPLVGHAFLSFLIIGIYLYTSISAGDNLDLYGAVVYYINWIEEIAYLKFDKFSLINTYLITNLEISAPEPIPGVLIYLLTRFIKSPSFVLHVLNIVVLIFYGYFIIKVAKEYIIFVILIFAIITGYYEYVLIHMTHRFKIAFLFFMLSFYYKNKKDVLSKIYFVLTLLSHFSMILILPAIFILDKLGFNVLPNLSIRMLLLIAFTLLILFISGISEIDQDYIQYILGTKFSQSSLTVDFFFDSWIYLIILLFVFLGFYKLLIRIIKFFSENNIIGNLFWVSILMLYLVFSLSVIGSSRLLMLYYLCFLIIILANWSNFNYNKKVNITILFAPVFLYSLINGFIKGPIFILYFKT